MNRIHRQFTLGFLLILTTFLSLIELRAADETGIKGKISAVDVSSKMVSIQLESTEIRNFTVSDSTQITVNDNTGKLGDLNIGMDAVIVPGEFPAIAQTVTATGEAKQEVTKEPPPKKKTGGKKKKKKKKK